MISNYGAILRQIKNGKEVLRYTAFSLLFKNEWDGWMMGSDHSWYDWTDMNCFAQVKWKDAHWQTERKMQPVIKKLGVKTHWRQKSLSHVNSGRRQKNQMGLISLMSSFTHVAIIRNGPRALCAHVGNILGELRRAKAVLLYRSGQLDKYQLFSTFYRQIIDLHLEKKKRKTAQ